MTKKQYKVGYFEDPNPVDDYVETIDGEYLTATDVAKLLNKLSEENNQLKREKKRYKQLSEIRAENINNRILSIKEFINNCEDEKVKDTLEDLFYSEVKEYDLAKENRKLKKEVERLKCINKQLEERLDKDIVLNMDCGDVDD